jgi:hypothetical protein
MNFRQQVVHRDRPELAMGGSSVKERGWRSGEK